MIILHIRKNFQSFLKRFYDMRMKKWKIVETQIRKFLKYLKQFLKSYFLNQRRFRCCDLIRFFTVFSFPYYTIFVSISFTKKRNQREVFIWKEAITFFWNLFSSEGCCVWFLLSMNNEERFSYYSAIDSKFFSWSTWLCNDFMDSPKT